MSSVSERSEIDTEYKWDLESIYATDDDWEDAYEAVAERVDELQAYEGQATDDAEALLEVLERRPDPPGRRWRPRARRRTVPRVPSASAPRRTRAS